MPEFERIILQFEQRSQTPKHTAEPFLWAKHQLRLASALFEHSKNCSSDERIPALDVAFKKSQLALEVASQKRTPDIWAAAHYRIGAILIAKDEPQRAIVHFENALQVYSPVIAAKRWAETMSDLAFAFETLAIRSFGATSLVMSEASITTWDKLGEIFSRGGAWRPLDIARASRGAAQARITLARQLGPQVRGNNLISQAVVCAEAAKKQGMLSGDALSSLEGVMLEAECHWIKGVWDTTPNGLVYLRQAADLYIEGANRLEKVGALESAMYAWHHLSRAYSLKAGREVSKKTRQRARLAGLPACERTQSLALQLSSEALLALSLWTECEIRLGLWLDTGDMGHVVRGKLCASTAGAWYGAQGDNEAEAYLGGLLARFDKTRSFFGFRW